MKASYNWLRTLLPQLTASPAEVAKLLTSAGLEVEGIEEYGAAAAHCFVVAVRKVEPHPQRSGLHLVTVDLGGAEQTVVCGASNVPAPGGLVVLAPLGTELPAKAQGGVPFVVGSREIGGIVSEGMLCSEAELGLSSEGAGLLVLPAGSASAGAPLTAVLPEASDTIFEIGLTPNRPDGLGHVGLARELAVLLGITWKRPEPSFPSASPDAPSAESMGAVTRLETPELCTHFSTAVLTEVQVGPSPAWLRYRLASLGVRSISNVVDVTNLVMFEWGHPMHAYDLDALSPLPQQAQLADHARLSVRHAHEGEVLVTLDGVSRTLVDDDLVIADGKGAVGLAGVMGGQSSEVKAGSTQLLLEAAVFSTRSVRRTARRHALNSEASHRFERGVDSSDGALVLASAALHLQRLAGAKVCGGVLHAGANVHFPRSVSLRQARLRSLLGCEVPWGEALITLQRLGLTRQSDSGSEADGSASAIFEVPPHRHDLSREVDLIEEVVRIHGIDRIPARLPRIQPSRDVGGVEAFTAGVRAAAEAQGLSEAILSSLTNQEAMERGRAAAPSVLLKNPLTDQGSGLLTSVVPGLLETVSRAARHGQPSARLFAVQSVFTRRGAGEQPLEKLAFGAVLCGARPGWLEKPSGYDVWDAKGLASSLAQALGARGLTLGDCDQELWHPRARASLLDEEGHPVAHFGLLHPDVAEAYELLGPVVVVTLELESLRRAQEHIPRHRPLPRFPASSRDVAVIVREALAAGEVERVLSERAGPLAESVRLFDRYVGAGVPAGHVSLAFRVTYRKSDRTLTDAEVDAVHEQVVAEVQTRFGATLRAGG